MKNIIIFGGSGSLGRYFIKYWNENAKEKQEYSIYAIGKRKEDYFWGMDNVIYISMDITDKDAFQLLPKENVYAVIHLAGMMPARMEGYDPYQYININIIGTLNILEYCKENKIDRILFSQSFGDIKEQSENNITLKVNTTKMFSFTSDHTIYVLTKNFGVDLIENYHQLYGLKNFIFRLPTIYLYDEYDIYYVNGQPRKIGYRLIIDKAIRGEAIEIWGDPKRVKDMVYVKDFCQMIYKALFINRDTGYYNVGTGIGTSLEDWIKGVITVFNEKKISKLIYRPDMPNSNQYIMDITEAIKELGYKPQYSYIDALKDMKLEMQNRKCVV